MKPTPSRKSKPAEIWPRKVTVGRESVSVYRRLTPLGNFAFMVASYASGKRKFISYAAEGEAIEAAGRLARRLSEADTKAAQLTEAQAVEYVNAARELQPLGISLTAAVAAIVEAVKLTGDLSGVAAAARFYKAKHKSVTAKRVADAVAEMLALKESRGASVRYLRDLRLRLAAFAEKFPCNVGSVQTSDIQAWLDGLKLSTQSYANYRRVAHVFFEFAKARGYCWTIRRAMLTGQKSATAKLKSSRRTKPAGCWRQRRTIFCLPLLWECSPVCAAQRLNGWNGKTLT